jgi:hypothetical protein
MIEIDGTNIALETSRHLHEQIPKPRVPRLEFVALVPEQGLLERRQRQRRRKDFDR